MPGRRLEPMLQGDPNAHDEKEPAKKSGPPFPFRVPTSRNRVVTPTTSSCKIHL